MSVKTELDDFEVSEICNAWLNKDGSSYADLVRTAIAADRAIRPITLPPAVLQALRFYANGDHFHIDGDSQEFDTVSGEPDNWLMSQKDEDGTMLEDGTIAKKALTGGLVWVDGDGNDAPAPVDGEIFTSAK